MVTRTRVFNEFERQVTLVFWTIPAREVDQTVSLNEIMTLLLNHRVLVLATIEPGGSSWAEGIAERLRGDVTVGYSCNLSPSGSVIAAMDDIRLFVWQLRADTVIIGATQKAVWNFVKSLKLVDALDRDIVVVYPDGKYKLIGPKNSVKTSERKRKIL